MLAHLTIKNFGLIDALTIEFADQLTVLTGETGAGKSIIIDALRYALGERLDPAQIRTKEAPCAVEAVFSLARQDAAAEGAFGEYLTDDDPSLIISRSSLPDGKSRIKVNGHTVTVAELKTLGDRLVDFHGPNDHQLLLDASSHLGMLDRLAAIDEPKTRYAALFASYSDIRKRLAEIDEGRASRDRELDLLAHQIQELERVELDDASYEKARDRERRLKNIRRLDDYTAQLIAILSHDDGGAGEKIAATFGPLKALTALDPAAAPFLKELETIQETHAALLAGLERYRADLSCEPGEDDAIAAKIDAYQDIIRRYGPTRADATAFREKAIERRLFLHNLDHNDTELRKDLARIERELTAAADKVTRGRKRAGESLKETIEKELRELGINRVRFETQIEKVPFNREGADNVTFYISPNAGEELKPLSAIVSSGEAARVMLALKKALIKVDPIPTLIFDEIDAQIGGRLGTITGQKLRELADERQVILITHLPQIASFGDAHYKITKTVTKNRTTTAVTLLAKEARIQELAQMMSGQEETAVARAHAVEMLTKAKKKIP